MNFLHKQFGDLVETEVACTLQKDDFLGQRVEHLAVDKLLHSLEKVARYGRKQMLLAGQGGAYADEFGDASRVDELGNLRIKVVRSQSALLNVAQDERRLLGRSCRR